MATTVRVLTASRDCALANRTAGTQIPVFRGSRPQVGSGRLDRELSCIYKYYMTLRGSPSSEARRLGERLAGECLGVRMRLIDRVVTKIYNDALRPHGLRATQMNVMGVIALTGPVGPDRIGRMLHLSPSTLSRTVNRMKSRGWLAVRTGSDARRLTLVLTPRGRKILEEAREGWEKAQDQAAALLGSDGIACVHSIAYRIAGSNSKEESHET